jgi:nucleotide-binding universal stress UspA family protein
MTGQPVLVGVDNSDNATAALAWADAYAQAVGGRLVVVHALGLLEGAAHPRAEITAFYEARVRELDPEAQFVLRDGDPVGALLAEADAIAPSLIVVGRRGEGALGPAALGSTSTQIVERASYPVVVVPLPD